MQMISNSKELHTHKIATPRVYGFMAMKDMLQLRLETHLQHMHGTASFMYAVDDRNSFQLMPKCGAITLSASAYSFR